MQHAGGPPLSPPPGPGVGPGAPWAQGAGHPGPGVPPGHPARHGGQIHPVQQGGQMHPPLGPPQPPGPAPRHAPAPPSNETTGHIQLPPGGPVPVPNPMAGAAVPDAAQAAVAVLLIGPAGAGKTTVARHWADTRRVPTAHISLDDVREWVRSGFADPTTGWNDNSEAQYRLARRTCGFAARNFLANRISCILDDAVFPDRPVVGLGGWKRHVGPGLLPVVLLPGLEIVLERNAERSGNRRLSDDEVAGIHGRMAGWYGSGLPIIDNSKYDVETTARVLDDVVARSLASPPSW
ncbi:Pro-rich N-terminal domain-containing protein [Streptomyces sp. H27-D2]|uniref:Pro-rich N-terminal domain-containing protein n=1 Tax=Streptomyces sp. H27-D2 TaxID=3046304 RepID=UPI002DBF44CE|nr:Pro-rich N-terminal domain-containing protein [Streptomyces sp. H27-D2]MEC4015555.1 Pro-rich N-terminal domain-containing protein [Streptomyces sp. H27-D2]